MKPSHSQKGLSGKLRKKCTINPKWGNNVNPSVIESTVNSTLNARLSNEMWQIRDRWMHLAKSLILWLFSITIHNRASTAREKLAFSYTVYLEEQHSYNERQKPQLLNTNCNTAPWEVTLLAPQIPSLLSNIS